MPAHDQRLDDAIRTAVSGGGRNDLHQVVADIWRQMSDKAIRALDAGPADRPAGARIRVVASQP